MSTEVLWLLSGVNSSFIFFEDLPPLGAIASPCKRSDWGVELFLIVVQEVKVGNELNESGENVFVGGKNRWRSVQLPFHLFPTYKEAALLKVSAFFMCCQAIDFQFLWASCRALHVNMFLVEGDLQLFIFCKLGALVAQLPCTGVF